MDFLHMAQEPNLNLAEATEHVMYKLRMLNKLSNYNVMYKN